MPVFRLLLIPAALLALNACQPATKSDKTPTDTLKTDTTATTATPMLPDPKTFNGKINGEDAHLFILKNGDMQVALSDYGARWVGALVPDKDGNTVDVVPGFATAADYAKPGGAFFGPVVGRFANRIGKGTFTLDGKTYHTELNNNGNTLHSGATGFHAHVWKANQPNEHTLELTYTSPDGEGGFPGEVKNKVTYTLTDNNILRIDYTATTNKPTPYNVTNHAFFNLNGEGSGTINNHLMMLNADRVSAVDDKLIPQGEPISVENTPLDFRKPMTIGSRIDDKNEQLVFGKGYDHNFVLNKTGKSLTKAAEVVGDKTGIKMEVWTTEPAVQFYGGNFFGGKDSAKNGKIIGHREAFALETQHYPDSPNHPTYPNTILKPGETYYQTTEYRFSTVK